MHKLFVAVAAASVLGVVCPASAQLAREQKAEQQPVPTTGTMHDHVERAERVVKQLLEQRSSHDTDRSRLQKSAKSEAVAVERTQLERLQTELNEINTASSDTSGRATSALDGHVTTAQGIATGMANQPVAASQPEGRVEIVVVERAALKELKDEIEAIEKLAKASHRVSK